MFFSKQDRIEGRKLYKRLTGLGPNATPMFKGGLLEVNSFFSCLSYSDLKRVIDVLENLSEKEINNPYAFLPLIKNDIGDVSSCLSSLWLSYPQVKQETKQTVFEMLCSSFPDPKQAKRAKELYETFFRTCDNPWTVENASKPGYQVIPYFQVTDENFPMIVPPHNRDQRAYQGVLEKEREKQKKLELTVQKRDTSIKR